MSTAFDVKFVALAKRLLLKFGIEGTFTSTTIGRYDGFAGTKVPDSTTESTVLMSPPLNDVLSLSSQTTHGSGGGSAVAVRVLQAIMNTVDTVGAALTEPTAKRDRVTIQGVEFRIVKVTRLSSGDDVAAYVLDLEKT